VELIPERVLGVSPIKTTTAILGTKMEFPIVVSPPSGHSMLHPDGELATYQAATAPSNTPFIVSDGSSFPFEKIAPAAKGPLWFQLFPKLELDDNREVLDRV
jgi:4-hydroxymandelate oxidase